MIIASTSLHIKELKKAFGTDQLIRVEDIFQFYTRFGEKLNRSLIDWRIHVLTQKGILHRIERGTYSLSALEVKDYVPAIDRPLKNLYRTLHKEFPFVDVCIWSTKWINEFMQHQPGRFNTLIEVEKELMEPVFHFVQGKTPNVFLDPSEEVMNNYITNTKEATIVTHLRTEAPTQLVDTVLTCTIEKILVDIYSNPLLFAAQQGAELRHIYSTAFEKYRVSTSKLLRYAGRRNKKQSVERLIEQISNKRQ